MRAFYSTVNCLLLSAALTGCNSMQTHFAPARVAQSFPMRTPPQKIELYRSQAPTKKYVEIGAASYCCSTDVNQQADRLRQIASDNGGDALIGFDIDATGGASAAVIRFE